MAADPADDESRDEPHTDPQPTRERYSFSTFTRQSWLAFRGAARSLILLFGVAHVLAAVLPYLVAFDVPAALGYPLVFLFRVVLPVLIGTVAMAIASSLLLDSPDPGEASTSNASLRSAWREIGPRRIDVVVMGLVASLFAIAAVLFLGAYGFLILHLFYGPPIAIQVLVGEAGSYRESLQRARLLLRGNWRTILYLLNASLAIGAVALLVLDLIVRFVGGGGGALLAVFQGLVLGALTALLAGAQVSLFLYLRRDHSNVVDPTEVSEAVEGPNPG